MSGGAPAAVGLQRLGDVVTPVHHAALDAHAITSLACGDGSHVVALTSVATGGRVVVWGRNELGELGIGRGEAGGTAPRVLLTGVLRGRTAPLVHVAAGAHFTLVGGHAPDDVIGWGQGDRLQLGLQRPAGACEGGAAGDGEAEEASGTDAADGVQWTPRALASLGSTEALRLSSLVAGAQHAGALLVARTGRCEDRRGDEAVGGSGVLWGCGDFGALGRGDASDHADAAPCHRGSLVNVSLVQLACGRDTSAALDTDGRVHAWGRMWGDAAARPLAEPALHALSAPGGGGGALRVHSVCCSGRRLLLQCSADGVDGARRSAAADGRAAACVLSSVFGGRLAPLRSLDALPVTSIGAAADVALVTLADGRCLRLRLSGAAGEVPNADIEPEGAPPPPPAPIGAGCARCGAVRSLRASLDEPSTRACLAPDDLRVPPMTSECPR